MPGMEALGGVEPASAAFVAPRLSVSKAEWISRPESNRNLRLRRASRVHRAAGELVSETGFEPAFARLKGESPTLDDSDTGASPRCRAAHAQGTGPR